MKVGDTVPVTIAGHVVAQAQVKEMGDGKATLIVPATLVVMGTRTDLTDVPEEKIESGSDHQILGVERDGVPEPTEPLAPVGEPAPVTNVEQPTNVGETPVDPTAPTTIESEAVVDAQQQEN